MRNEIDVQPPLLCRLLFAPFVTRCRSQDGWLLLETIDGQVAIAQDQVAKCDWLAQWPFGSLTMYSARGIVARLDWLWEKDAVKVRDLCREARHKARLAREKVEEQNRERLRIAKIEAARRERLKFENQINDLVKRFDLSLRQRWQNYSCDMDRWLTILNPAKDQSTEQIHLWLQSHTALPIPIQLNHAHISSDIAGLSIVGPAHFPESETSELAQLRTKMERFLRVSVPQYDQAMMAWKSVFERNRYVANHDCTKWLDPHRHLIPPEQVDRQIAKFLPWKYGQVLMSLCEAFRNLDASVDNWNENLVQIEMQKWPGFVECFSNGPATSSQREAIVSDEDNNLVIAGAGTGKTATIVGKVGYVLQKRLAASDEILLLAYTKKAAEELQTRIQKQLDIPVKVRTFHALGLEIIGAATGRKPDLFGEEQNGSNGKLLKELAQELVISNPAFADDLLSFQASYSSPFSFAWNFTNVGEYFSRLRASVPVSLRGERMRSFEEIQIANSLALYDVRYLYEQPYQVNLTTASRRQYKPDFYLPDHRIYIEHFAMDEHGNPPPWFSDSDRRRYVADVEWKRRIHRENGTRLIETYSWQERTGQLR